MPFYEATYRGPGKPWRLRLRNTIALEGLDHLLGSALDAQAPFSRPTYISLIAETGFTEISDEDTAASHAGWQEFTDYIGSTRPVYSSTLDNATLTTSTPAIFTLTASGSIRGFFMVNNVGLAGANSKGSSAGVLWSMAASDESHSVSRGGVITVHYTLKAAGGHR